MFMHRVTRGYMVLIAGLIAFFGRRLLAGDALWSPGMLDAEILSETEMWIVISTALLIGPAVALGRLRAMLIALPFSSAAGDAVPDVLSAADRLSAAGDGSLARACCVERMDARTATGNV